MMENRFFKPVLALFFLLGAACSSPQKEKPDANYYRAGDLPSQAELDQERRLLEEQKKTIVGQLNRLMKEEQDYMLQRIEDVSKHKSDTITLLAKDEVGIEVWLNNLIRQQDGFPLEMSIPSDGMVFLPGVGEVQFAGRSPDQIQDEIRERFSPILINPIVKVRVIRSVGAKVAIAGEVQILSNRDTGPGVYEIEGETLLSSFISRVGGYTKDADIQNIRVSWPDGVSKVINLQRILDGRIEENVFLKGGETVYIPELSRTSFVTVMGHVNSPGTYPLERGTRLSQLMARVGGISRTGTSRRIVTVRGDRYHPQVMMTDLWNVYYKGLRDQDLMLESGDMVYVPMRRIALAEEVIRVMILPLRPVTEFYLLDRLIKDQ